MSRENQTNDQVLTFLHKTKKRRSKFFLQFLSKKHLTNLLHRGKMSVTNKNPQDKDCDEDGTVLKLSESRRTVRADSRAPMCISLPSRMSECKPGHSVPRVKGKGLLEPKVTVFRNLSGTAGIHLLVSRKGFFLGRFLFGISAFERKTNYDHTIKHEPTAERRTAYS